MVCVYDGMWCVYDGMCDIIRCWSEDCDERPTMEQIRTKLTKLSEVSGILGISVYWSNCNIMF